jgi:hypothetical protein
VIGERSNSLCDTNPTETPTIKSDKSYILILCFFTGKFSKIIQYKPTKCTYSILLI